MIPPHCQEEAPAVDAERTTTPREGLRTDDNGPGYKRLDQPDFGIKDLFPDSTKWIRLYNAC